MISFVEGKIKNKTHKEGKGPKGPWIRTSYALDNDLTYSTFEAQYSNFQEGDIVKINFEKNGQFNNIKEICSLHTSQEKQEGKVDVVGTAFLGLCRLYQGQGIDLVIGKLPETIKFLDLQLEGRS